MELLQEMIEEAKDLIIGYDPQELERVCDETRKSIGSSLPFLLHDLPHQVVFSIFPVIQIRSGCRDKFLDLEALADLITDNNETDSLFELSPSVKIVVDEMRMVNDEQANRILLAVGHISASYEIDRKANAELLRKYEEENDEREL